MEVLKIFLKMKEQYIKTEMEYPANFWMMLFSGVLTRILGMAAPFVIYSNISDIAGWKQTGIAIVSGAFLRDGSAGNQRFFDRSGLSACFSEKNRSAECGRRAHEPVFCTVRNFAVYVGLSAWKQYRILVRCGRKYDRSLYDEQHRAVCPVSH